MIGLVASYGVLSLVRRFGFPLILTLWHPKARGLWSLRRCRNPPFSSAPLFGMLTAKGAIVNLLATGGGPSSHVSQEKLAEAAGLIPNCRLVTIEGAGHAVHQTRPEEYKDILRDFLFVLIAYLPQTRQYAHDAGTIKPIEE